MLTIGTLLPQTGSLAFLGPPEFAGVRPRRRRDQRDRRRARPADVVGIEGDSGDTTTEPGRPDRRPPAVRERRRHHRRRVVERHADGHRQDHGRRRHDVLAGEHVDGAVDATPTRACTSAPRRRTSTRATCSASSSSTTATRRWRSSTSTTATATASPTQATATIEESGGEVVVHAVYDPAATSFDSEVDEIVAADPDAIIVIGFDESSRILRTMVEKGIGPTRQDRLRLRRQHRQRPRRRLRRRQLIRVQPVRDDRRGPGPSARALLVATVIDVGTPTSLGRARQTRASVPR